MIWRPGRPAPLSLGTPSLAKVTVDCWEQHRRSHGNFRIHRGEGFPLTIPFLCFTESDLNEENF